MFFLCSSDQSVLRGSFFLIGFGGIVGTFGERDLCPLDEDSQPFENSRFGL